MNNELINQLSKLTLEEKALKRNLNRNYYNIEIRNKLFNDLNSIQNEIKRVKFKIRMEKEKRNDKK